MKREVKIKRKSGGQGKREGIDIRIESKKRGKWVEKRKTGKI